MMDYLISVCITSYNRVHELRRCIDSIDSKYTDKVEIVVSEDCSPKKDEIKEMVLSLKETKPYQMVFNSNDCNLGYDRNLKKLIMLAHGQYILYFSDDDVLFPHTLDKVIDFIESKKEKPALIFSPFRFVPTNEIKRKYNQTHDIVPGSVSAAKYLYDAILFSGLIFRRDTVIHIDAERFKNMNYFQVYLFLTVIYRYGGSYLNELVIDSISDGENAYGTVKSGESNALLADRQSIYSNLEFNKGLFAVIQYFDKDHDTNVFQAFAHEFSVRTFGGLCRARQLGLQDYKRYWKKLNDTINLDSIATVYYFFIALFGEKISSFVFIWLKKIVFRVRARI